MFYIFFFRKKRRFLFHLYTKKYPNIFYKHALPIFFLFIYKKIYLLYFFFRKKRRCTDLKKSTRFQFFFIYIYIYYILFIYLFFYLYIFIIYIKKYLLYFSSKEIQLQFVKRLDSIGKTVVYNS